MSELHAFQLNLHDSSVYYDSDEDEFRSVSGSIGEDQDTYRVLDELLVGTEFFKNNKQKERFVELQQAENSSLEPQVCNTNTQPDDQLFIKRPRENVDVEMIATMDDRYAREIEELRQERNYQSVIKKRISSDMERDKNYSLLRIFDSANDDDDDDDDDGWHGPKEHGVSSKPVSGRVGPRNLGPRSNSPRDQSPSRDRPAKDSWRDRKDDDRERDDRWGSRRDDDDWRRGGPPSRGGPPGREDTWRDRGTPREETGGSSWRDRARDRDDGSWRDRAPRDSPWRGGQRDGPRDGPPRDGMWGRDRDRDRAPPPKDDDWRNDRAPSRERDEGWGRDRGNRDGRDNWRGGDRNRDDRGPPPGRDGDWGRRGMDRGERGERNAPNQTPSRNWRAPGSAREDGEDDGWTTVKY